MTWIAGEVVTAEQLNVAAPQEWEAYVPTIAGGYSVGSGNVQAWWVRHGETVHMFAIATLGAGFTMGNGFGFSLPVDSVNGCTSYARFGSSGVNVWEGAASIGSSTVTAFVIGTSGVAVALGSTSPFSWKATDTLEIGATYRGVPA